MITDSEKINELYKELKKKVIIIIFYSIMFVLDLIFVKLIYLNIPIALIFIAVIIMQVYLIRDYIKLIKLLEKKQKQKIFEDYYNSRINLDDIFEQFVKDFFNQHQQQNQHINNSLKIDHAYQLLKLSKSDSTKTIKLKYKELAMKWHPDKWTTSSTKNQNIATKNFKKLQSAYDLIKKDKNIV